MLAKRKQKKIQYAEDVTLNRDLCKTPRKLKRDLIGYYLVRGEIEKGCGGGRENVQ